jgi:hypothetical protein
MSFLKNLFFGIVDLVLGPVIRLKDCRTMTAFQNIFNLGEIASRAIIIGSFFFAIPKAVVITAWVWIFGGIIAGVVLAIIGMVAIGGMFAFASATVDAMDAGMDKTAGDHVASAEQPLAV